VVLFFASLPSFSSRILFTPHHRFQGDLHCSPPANLVAHNLAKVIVPPWRNSSLTVGESHRFTPSETRRSRHDPTHSQPATSRCFQAILIASTAGTTHRFDRPLSPPPLHCFGTIPHWLSLHCSSLVLPWPIPTLSSAYLIEEKESVKPASF
jgi:hypothetical protein